MQYDCEAWTMRDHLKAHFGYLAAGAGGDVSQSAMGLVVDSGLDCDTFNVVVSDEGAAAPTRGGAAAIAAGFGERALTWWVGPGAPAAMAAELTHLGLLASPAEPALALDLADSGADAAPCGLATARVSTRAALADYARVLAANWSPPDPNVTRFYQSAGEAALAPASPLVLLLGLVAGAPVATAEVALGADGVAGLYNVATLAAHRRRGYGAAITAAAIGTAREAGMRRLELQSSDDGLRLYERTGFRRYGEWTEFQRPARPLEPRPGRSRRSA